jgi:hypothetical protein
MTRPNMKIKQCFKYGLLSLGSILSSLSLSVKAEDKMSELVLTQVKDVPTQIAGLETRFHEIKGIFKHNPETCNPVREILDLYGDLEKQIEIVNLFIKSASALDGSKITESMIERMSVVTSRVGVLISLKEKGHHYVNSEMTEAVYLVFTKEIEEIIKELI